ncbi:MAG: 4Fe-4S binding protein [Halanaerobiales bacterium]|nr:4Fe-4S binding protein [Halanaerobiales bacterium]
MVKDKNVVFDIERCKGCELCTAVCPVSIIDMSEEINSHGYHFAKVDEQDKCISCAMCATMCPDVVIKVYKEE